MRERERVATTVATVEVAAVVAVSTISKDKKERRGTDGGIQGWKKREINVFDTNHYTRKAKE